MGENEEGLTEEFFPAEDQEIRKVILEVSKVEEGQKTTIVSGRVVELTLESKTRSGEYEMVRGYVRIAPDDLYVHGVIHNPSQLIDGTGNVGILGQYVRLVGGELDQAVVEMAHRHEDRKIVARESKPRRVDAGKEVEPRKAGEVL